MFGLELDYAGLFRFGSVAAENMNEIVLIQCPQILFPFAREIIATTVRNGGFPPLMLEPVDFARLYRERMAQTQGSPPPMA